MTEAPTGKPMLVTFRDKNGRSWPKYESGMRGVYMPPGKAFPKRYRSDAHFAAYSVHEQPRRLATPDAIVQLAPRGGLDIAFLIEDCDSPWHGVKSIDWTPDHTAMVAEWFEGERPKLEALNAAHPGLYAYRTRGGYRAVYMLARPFTLRKPEDALAWRHRYFRLMMYFARAFGLIFDSNCADWTRFYRHPFVVRDGADQVPAEIIGDAAQLGAFDHEPTDADLEADLETARLVAASPDHDDWSRIVKAFEPKAPPAPRGAARAAPPPSARSATPHGRQWLPGQSLMERYIDRAINDSCDELEGTGKGDRNYVLNAKAFTLGRLVGAGLVARSVIEDALRGAAARSGMADDEDKIEVTLKSGLDAGERSPKVPILRGEDRASSAPPTQEEEDEQSESSSDENDEREAGPASGSYQTSDARPPSGWEDQFIETDRGERRANVANAMLVLENHPGWKNLIAHDDLASRMMLMGPSPAHAGLVGETYPRPWQDHDDILTTSWLQRKYDINVTDGVVAKAAQGVAHHHRFHPVRDYLGKIKWDGVDRLPTWLTVHLGVEANDYTRAVGIMWMISAVARVQRPGCKADCAIIFEGLQALKKSTALEVLGGDWFTDQVATLGSKDADEQIRGVWLIELGELSSMTKSEVEIVKAFMSRKTDRFRVAYGRHVAPFPRQCIFAGSTNAQTYLKDETGNRRFWPVTCTKRVDIPALAAVRDQLWAEAQARFARGEDWWVEDDGINALAQAEQEARYQPDAWEAAIATYVFGLTSVTIGDILTNALRIDVGKWAQGDQTRVAKCLHRLGWERVRRRTGEGATPSGGSKREYRYERKAEPGSGSAPLVPLGGSDGKDKVNAENIPSVPMSPLSPQGSLYTKEDASTPVAANDIREEYISNAVGDLEGASEGGPAGTMGARPPHTSDATGSKSSHVPPVPSGSGAKATGTDGSEEFLF